MKLSLCIVGCGSYARTVMDDIEDMTDSFEFYFASRDAEKARQYSEDYSGAGSFGSYEDAASDDRVDALYFFTPHDLHLESAKLAARHRKHILMEKPIARTIPEGRALMRTAKEAGVKLMVAENFRFMPAVIKAKALIAEGAIGDLRFLSIRTDGYDRLRDEWRSSLARSGGGRFIDGGVHYVDILLNIAGFPERVYAAAQEPKLLDIEGEDGLFMTAHLPGGATAVVHYSAGTSIQQRRDGVEITGTKGLLTFNPHQPDVTLETLGGAKTFETEVPKRGVPGMVREFRDAVAEDREPVMSGIEALNDLAVVLAAYESIKRGEPVEVSMPGKHDLDGQSTQ